MLDQEMKNRAIRVLMSRTKKPLIIRANGSAMAAPSINIATCCKSKKDMTEEEKNVFLLEKLLQLQRRIEEKKAKEIKDQESAATGGEKMKQFDV